MQLYVKPGEVLHRTNVAGTDLPNDAYINMVKGVTMRVDKVNHGTGIEATVLEHNEYCRDGEPIGIPERYLTDQYFEVVPPNADL